MSVNQIEKLQNAIQTLTKEIANKKQLIYNADSNGIDFNVFNGMTSSRIKDKINTLAKGAKNHAV